MFTLIKRTALALPFVAAAVTAQADGPEFNLSGHSRAILGMSDDADFDEMDLSAESAQITAELILTDDIKATLTLDLAEAYGQHLMRDGDGVRSRFDWERFIEEATVTIDLDEMTGQPIVVVVGKQSIPLTAEFSQLPGGEFNGPNYRVSQLRQVFGVVLHASHELLGDIQVAISETRRNGYDFDIDTDSLVASVRLTRAITDQLEVVGSFAYMMRENVDDGYQASLGLVYDVNGTLQVWVEGIYIADHPRRGDEYRISAGADYALTDRTTLSGAVTHIEDRGTTVRAGVSHDVNADLTVGAEVKYEDRENGDDDFSFAATAEHNWGSSNAAAECHSDAALGEESCN